MLLLFHATYLYFIFHVYLIRIFYIIPFSGGLLVGILSWAGIRNWRWLMGILSAPAALLSLLYFIIPESPRWLLAKGNKYKFDE